MRHTATGQQRVPAATALRGFASALVLVAVVSGSSKAASRPQPATPQASTPSGQPPDAAQSQKISDIVRKISEAYSRLSTYEDAGDARWSSTFPDGHVTTEQHTFSTTLCRDSALQWTRRTTTPSDSVNDLVCTIESVGRGEFAAKDAKGDVIATGTDAAGLVEELAVKAGMTGQFELLVLRLLHAGSPARVAEVLQCTKESDWHATTTGDRVTLLQTFSAKGITQTTALSFDAQTFLLRRIHFTRSFARPASTNANAAPALEVLQSFPDSELTVTITPTARER